MECNSLELYKYPYYRKYPFKGIIKILSDIPESYFSSNTYDIRAKHTICILINHKNIENLPIILPAGILDIMNKNSEYFISEISRIELINILKKILYKENSYFYRRIHYLDKILNALVNKLDTLLEEESKERQIYNAGKKIYSAWYDAYSNPNNSICRRRLLREFNDINN